MNSIIVFIVLSLCALPSFCLQCRFSLGPYTYDICPLIFVSETPSAGRVMHIQQQNGELSSTLGKTTVYDIDLGGDGLYHDPSLPASKQCPQGTWICMKTLSTNTEPDSSPDATEIVHALPLSGNIQYDNFHGKVDAEAQLSMSDGGFDIPILDITLKGGYYSSQLQRVQFLFICDESGTQEPTLPTIKTSGAPLTATANDVYTHTFTWCSRHACPVQADTTSPHPPAPWWSSFFVDEDEAPKEEESSGLRPNKGKTAGIVIGSLAGVCLLLSGVYYLHSRRRSKAYDAPSLQEMFIQWLTIPAYYLQQIPWSSISFSSIRSFVTKPFSRNSRLTRRYRYSPLFAEEYEIQDRDEENNLVVDLQAQQTAPSRIKASRGSMGYGSI